LLTHPRYESGELLGQGGQGLVLRVTDREAPTRALVAKILRNDGLDSAALRGEFALLSRLTLPGLVRVHDLGSDTATGAPFLVEDFVDGRNAKAFIGDGPADQRAERLRYVLAGAARALSSLHDVGFVHGDLKPSHVVVTAAREVVLLDLGSAVERRAATRTHSTPGYAAPELVAGAPASAASDLFALGALAHAAALGSLPAPGVRGLGSRARWLGAGLCELLEQLLAVHPRDRCADAVEVLARLGSLAQPFSGSSLPAPLGREGELAQLLASTPHSVRYVCGASGIGKSHLLREVWTRTLLAGSSARYLLFPCQDEALIGRLLRYFHGSESDWPFAVAPSEQRPVLLLLDALERAPSELVEALEAFRCRAAGRCLQVLAACRAPPRCAPSLTLGPLADEDFRRLAAELGLGSREALAVGAALSEKNPGWLLALRGRAPLSSEMVVERVQHLEPATRELVGAVAACGGELSLRLAAELFGWSLATTPGALAQAFEAGLLVRQLTPGGVRLSLPSATLARELAAPLATFELTDRLAAALLRDETAPARVLLTLAQGGPCPPAQREALLVRAAAAARSAGLAGAEVEALLALAAYPSRRNPTLLLRLERLTRDVASPGGHPEVLRWLEQAVSEDDSLKPLVLRRYAERAARAGELADADRWIEQSRQTAVAQGDALSEALALASEGAIALYRADWRRAARTLELARQKLSGRDDLDAEELARLDHNAGVVALYENRLERAVQAFERSVSVKRALGDRAGVRSCLLNLGLALLRLRRFEQAESVLREALELARSLAQAAGEAWCLAARAELEVRSARPRAAERTIEEANQLSASAPPAIRADLLLLSAEVALLDGDGARALLTLARLDPELSANDPSIAARALLVEADARLALLPAQPRRAARLALGALRLARGAQLQELEELSVATLKRTLGQRALREQCYVETSMPQSDEPEWAWLRAVGNGLERDQAALGLCQLIVNSTRAERVIVALLGDGGGLELAWGADLDGFALSSAGERVDSAFLESVLASDSPVYQRAFESGSRIGARAAVGPTRSVVLLAEHRFRPGYFDRVAAETLGRWTTLAALTAQLGGSGAPRAEPVLTLNPVEPSTRVPQRVRRREFPEILGTSSALGRALDRLDAALDSALPVLLRGETGSGKDLFARALHQCGPRAARPLVAVNCAAIADNLFESELFGHARGAFTGAERARAGLVAQAEGGTLFLDEVAELSPGRQAALLRLLESGVYRPVGSDEERKADVRIVAATNRDLQLEAEQGRFRFDLLFRLNVLEIAVPPLRARREDIPLLIQAFFARSGASLHVSEAALARLRGYAWPGNVRELEHLMQRLLALGGTRVELADLPRPIRNAAPSAGSPLTVPIATPDSPRAELERALTEAGGNITHAARALGLTRHGLKKRMLRLGVRVSGASRA
jgi:DNA-binding NtrC family response regulator/tetratricopeptide (TPR) repeat protein